MTAEVLSVPVGQTGEFIERFRIHACPERFPYRQTDYITFRRSGGFMDEVFSLSESNIFVFDPFDDAALDKHKSENYFKRLQGYILARRVQESFSLEPYRFYALYEEDSIALPHCPTMARNPQGHCYFTMEELTSGKAIVEVSSKKHKTA